MPVYTTYGSLVGSFSPSYYFKLDNASWPVVQDGSTAITLAQGGSFANFTANQTGIVNKCVSSGNTTNYSYFNTSESSSVFTTAYTFAGWVKFNGNNNGTLVGLNNGQTGSNLRQFKIYAQYINGNILLGYDYRVGTTTTNVEKTTSATTGVWYHVAITVPSTGSTTFYVNGSSIGTDSGLPLISTDFNNLTKGWIGTPSTGNQDGFSNGYVDEIAVFPSALSAQDVSDLHVWPKSAYPVAAPATASALAVQPALSLGINLAVDPATASALSGDHRVSNFNYTKRLSRYLTDTLNVANYFKFDEPTIQNYGSAGDTEWHITGNYALATDNEDLGPGNEPYGRFDALSTAISVPRATEPLWNEDIENNNFALGLWINIGSDTGTFFEAIRQSDMTANIELGLNASGYVFGKIVTSTGTTTLTGSTDLRDGLWHLVGLSYNGSTMKLYHDDSVTASGSLTGSIQAIDRVNMLVGFTTPYNVKISTMFVDSTTVIGESEFDEIHTRGSQFITGHAIFPEPKVKISTSLYDYLDTLTTQSYIKFDGTGAPIDFANDSTVTWSLNGSAGDITPSQLSENVFAYKFVDKESFYEANAFGNYGTDKMTAFALFKVNPSLMNDGGTGVYGSKNAIWSPPSFGTGGLVIGCDDTSYFAYIANSDYSAETFLNSANNTLDSNYHLVVAVKDGTSFKLYLDGKEVASDTLDSSIVLASDPGYGFVGGNEVTWFFQDNTPTEKYIDVVGATATAFTAQEVFNLYRLALPVDDMTASATFSTPVGLAGFGPTINAAPATASALAVDPTQQDTVAPTIAPMTAFITTVTPNFATTANVTLGDGYFAASALMPTPQTQIGDEHGAAIFIATAEFPMPQIFIPGFYNASPSIATALFVDPALASTLGARVLAQPMTARAFSVTPPAYLSLFDDRWFNRLYAQHRDNPVVPTKTFLHWFTDTSGAVGGTLTNNGASGVNNATIVGSNATGRSFSVGYNDNQDRKAVRLENIGFSYSTSTTPGTNDRGYTLEMMIKTSKATQALGTGGWLSDSGSQSRESQIGLVNGKLYIMEAFNRLGDQSVLAPKNFSKIAAEGRSPRIIQATKTNIADGQWHHVIVQQGFDGRTQFWINGVLELQTYEAGYAIINVFGYNSADTTLSSDFYISAYGLNPQIFLPLTDVNLNYIAASNSIPISVEPMTANAVAGDETKAAGNRGRALMLYFWSTLGFGNNGHVRQPETGLSVLPLRYTPFDQGLGGEFDQETWFPFDTWGTTTKYADWDVFPVDVQGLYPSQAVKRSSYDNIRIVQNNGGVTGGNWNYEISDGFKDEIDNRRYIDLVNDINLEEYDAIFFRNYPDDGIEKDEYTRTESVDEYFGIRETTLFENFLKGLRAAVDTGISLFITNPQLAVDLKIIDRVEVVEQLNEVRAGTVASDPYSPTRILNSQIYPVNTGAPFENNLRWYDNFRNNRHRVVNVISGLTDDPSYIWKESLYWSDDAIITGFDAFDRYWNAYQERPIGLQIGDEFIFTAEDTNNRLQAVPFENVKAGKIVTAFASQIRKGTSLVANPYANYATTIAVSPGEVLDGTQVGGKIFVSFTESLKSSNMFTPRSYSAVELKSDYWINKAYADGSITLQTKNELIADQNNIDRKLAAGTITQAQYDEQVYYQQHGANIVGALNNYGDVQADVIGGLDELLPAGRGKASKTRRNVRISSTGSQFNVTYGTGLPSFTLQTASVYQEAPIYTPNINDRGFVWLSDRAFLDGTVVRPLVATATVESPTAVFVTQKDRTVVVQAMLATSHLNSASGLTPADFNVTALPMAATGIINEFVRRINADPMTASALLATNIKTSTVVMDEVIVYLYHVDPIVYLREDIIK